MAEKKYKVVHRDGVEKQLRKDIVSEKFTRDDLIVLQEWRQQIEAFGPGHIRNEKRWLDIDETKGKYMGYRSSSLGVLGKRIVYDTQGAEITILEVVAIDPEYYEDKTTTQKDGK